MRLRHHRPAVDESETGIDLAPMLDFVLNLLIFFIITAVFVKELGITISRPSSKQPQTQDQKKVKSMLVSIKKNGEIYIDQRLIDLRAVRSNIERFAAAETKSAPVVVIAEKEAPTGVLVQVMDQVRQGGITNVSIAATN